MLIFCALMSGCYKGKDDKVEETSVLKEVMERLTVMQVQEIKSRRHKNLRKTSTFCQTSRLFRNCLWLRPLVNCTCISAILSITSFNASVPTTLSSLSY